MRQFLPDPFHFAPPVAFRAVPGLRLFEAADVRAERGKLVRCALCAGLALLLLFGGLVVLGRTDHAATDAASHTLRQSDRG